MVGSGKSNLHGSHIGGRRAICPLLALVIPVVWRVKADGTDGSVSYVVTGMANIGLAYGYYGR